MNIGWKVVETDNFGRDYPDEKWATPYTYFDENQAKMVMMLLNAFFCSHSHCDRYWKVVPADYVLQPGFSVED